MADAGIACQFYEGETLRAQTGETIRPGGLELTGRALAFCGLPPGARVLDLACGSGATVDYLRAQGGLHALGLDASALLLANGLARRPGLPLARALGDRLPLPGETFAAAFMECSLSLMPDPPETLGELRRILAPGGWLILTDLYLRRPEQAGLLRPLPFACCLQGARSQDEITALVEAAGFTLALWEDHSAHLRHLAGKIILSLGSMQQFWSHTAPVEVDSFDLQLALARARPGYFLLVARKA